MPEQAPAVRAALARQIAQSVESYRVSVSQLKRGSQEGADVVLLSHVEAMLTSARWLLATFAGGVEARGGVEERQPRRAARRSP